jgi:hypothetical protein
VRAMVWVLQKENPMTSGSGPDEAMKRAGYYRERAAEARVKAEAPRDYEARRTMLQVAGIWDFMAETAEPRSKG